MRASLTDGMSACICPRDQPETELSNSNVRMRRMHRKLQRLVWRLHNSSARG